MQVQKDGRYKSTLDCAQKIYQEFGLKGIYKGQMITAGREWCGYGAYFMTYELLVQNTQHLTTAKIIGYGSLAGFAMWLPIFPIDSVKSRIQTDALTLDGQKYSSSVDCFRKVVATEGVRGLYKGFVPCMLRAAPVNAATFLAYETFIKLLGGRK